MNIKAIINYNENGELESVLLSREDFLNLIDTGKISITAVSGLDAMKLNSSETPVSIESHISKILTSIGIPKHIKGYAYLRDAIDICIRDFTTVNHITKVLYPMIARNHNDLPNRVERAIRHAIEVAWYPKNIEKVNQIFQTDYEIDSRKPTNSEFIALLSDSLRLEKVS